MISYPNLCLDPRESQRLKNETKMPMKQPLGHKSTLGRVYIHCTYVRQEKAIEKSREVIIVVK